MFAFGNFWPLWHLHQECCNASYALCRCGALERPHVLAWVIDRRCPEKRFLVWCSSASTEHVPNWQCYPLLIFWWKELVAYKCTVQEICLKGKISLISHPQEVQSCNSWEENDLSQMLKSVIIPPGMEQSGFMLLQLIRYTFLMSSNGTVSSERRSSFS